jgi:intracellular septation protein A/stress-induced morphogen
MKLLLDFLPIILFFGTFKYAEADKSWAAAFASQHLGFMVAGGAVGLEEAPVLLATVVVIVATMAQVAWLKWRGRKVDLMLWISLALVVVLGGLTVWLHSETFIKWKPSALYWAMGLTFWISQAVFDRTCCALLGQQMELPCGLASAQLRVDRILRDDGRTQYLGRLQLLDGDMGQLQAVRRPWPDAGLHGSARHLPEPLSEGRGAAGDAPVRVGAADIERALADALAPVALVVRDDGHPRRGAGAREGRTLLRVVSARFTGLTRSRGIASCMMPCTARFRRNHALTIRPAPMSPARQPESTPVAETGAFVAKPQPQA